MYSFLLFLLLRIFLAQHLLRDFRHVHRTLVAEKKIVHLLHGQMVYGRRLHFFADRLRIFRNKALAVLANQLILDV